MFFLFLISLHVHIKHPYNQYLTVLLCWGDLPRNRAKGVNPGGNGVDVSPPCFDMGGGITCLLSPPPPCFDPQICWVFFVLEN